MRGSTLKDGQTNLSKIAPTNWKISGPNCLSKCPKSREMDFGPFREKYFSTIFSTSICLKKWTSEGSSEGVTQIKNGSYIDPLAMRFSPRSEFSSTDVWDAFLSKKHTKSLQIYSTYGQLTMLDGNSRGL